MLRSVVLAFLLFCALFAHAAEATWIRVSSSHFSVLTDAGEKRGREVILRFEQMRCVRSASHEDPRQNARTARDHRSQE